MYFVKAKKHSEEKDVGEMSESPGRRDRYQRSDSARLLLQALPQPSPKLGSGERQQDTEHQDSLEDKDLGDMGCNNNAKGSGNSSSNLSSPSKKTSSQNAGNQSQQQHQDKLPKPPSIHQRQTQVEEWVQQLHPPTPKDSKNNQNQKFEPEELPDGACYRPRKSLSSIAGMPIQASSVAESSVDLKKAKAVLSPGGPSQNTSGLSLLTSNVMEEVTRPAQYIGTFSVSGSDKAVRERQMEAQLHQMRNAAHMKPVNLHISGAGVKITLQETNCVFMDHSLKRIWYATCDPEYCQFSFLAREPKTSAEVQYCHAFTTETAEQAEELIAIIGNAFKSTYTEEKKQPTFHELIARQVQQQQERFREIEEEAKNVLQKKLQQIATPTPFSEEAQSRMEARRKSEEMTPAALKQGRKWAKEIVELRRMQQPAATTDMNNSAAIPNRRSEIPSRQNTPQSSPLKRNSVPPQAMSNSPPVPSSPPPHPLSAMAIKEHLENKSSNGKSKFKGSPVTALKNEIDKRLTMTNGDDHMPDPSTDFRQEKIRLRQQHQALANRPLPLPPDASLSPSRSRSNQQHRASAAPTTQSQQYLRQQQQQTPKLMPQRSLDDYHLPRSSSSQAQLVSSPAQPRGGASGNVRLRESPRRHQPRPQSEIYSSSTGVAGGGGAGVPGGGGSSFYEQQRQSLLNNFAASFNLPPPREMRGENGMYIYGPPPPAPPDVRQTGGVRTSLAMVDGDADDEDDGMYEKPAADAQRERGRDNNRRGRNGRVGGAARAGSRDGKHSASPSAVLNSSQCQAYSGKGQIRVLHTQRSQSGERSGEPVVPRYQNDSPFHADQQDGSKYGLDSLMCLDRSHIHDETLRNSPWYQAGLAREIALEILQQEEVGAFIVRDSSTHPGCYALSVRVPKYENASGISHYLILRTQRGVKLKGLDKEWSTVTALVTHHTVMREMLPCTLRLPKVKGKRSQEMAASAGGDAAEKTEGNNYHQLSEVTGLVSNLKM